MAEENSKYQKLRRQKPISGSTFSNIVRDSTVLNNSEMAEQIVSVNSVIPINIIICATLAVALSVVYLLWQPSLNIPIKPEGIAEVYIDDSGKFAIEVFRPGEDSAHFLWYNEAGNYWDETVTDTLDLRGDYAIDISQQRLMSLEYNAQDTLYNLFLINSKGRRQLLYSVFDRYFGRLNYNSESNFGYIYVRSIYDTAQNITDLPPEFLFFKLQDGQYSPLPAPDLYISAATGDSYVPMHISGDYLFLIKFSREESEIVKYDLESNQRVGRVYGVDLIDWEYTISEQSVLLINHEKDQAYLVPFDYEGDLEEYLIPMPDYASSFYEEAELSPEGNIIFFRDTSILEYSGKAQRWSQVQLGDSVMIRSHAFNWRAGKGMFVSRRDGIDKLYGTSNSLESWAVMPLFRRANGQSGLVRGVLWSLLGLFSVSLVALFVRRSILQRAFDERTEIEKSPLSLVPDNPVNKDTLGIFDASKLALVKLIRNKDTEPPVTIAINGSWGSGKSSLMSMVKKGLEEDVEKGRGKYLNIWFNVWHFESEEHLLTVFLSKMVEGFEQYFGFRYRLRLFWNKVRGLSFSAKFRFFFAIFMITPILLFFIDYLIPESVGFDLHVLGLSGVFDAINLYIHIFSFKNDFQLSMLWLPLTAILTIVGIFSLQQSLVPSGLASFFQIFPVEELKKNAMEENPGFRDNYKKEFWRLLEAVDRNVKVVVFIDDIDRVTGSKVKQILEGINFISDTASRPNDIDRKFANMYFIFGMALKEVVKNLETALTQTENLTSQGEKDNLGQRFIEKMIDLTVQIPPMDTNGRNNLSSLFKNNDVSDTQ